MMTNMPKGSREIDFAREETNHFQYNETRTSEKEKIYLHKL